MGGWGKEGKVKRARGKGQRAKAIKQ